MCYSLNLETALWLAIIINPGTLLIKAQSSGQCCSGMRMHSTHANYLLVRVFPTQNELNCPKRCSNHSNGVAALASGSCRGKHAICTVYQNPHSAILTSDEHNLLQMHRGPQTRVKDHMLDNYIIRTNSSQNVLLFAANICAGPLLFSRVTIGGTAHAA